MAPPLGVAAGGGRRHSGLGAAPRTASAGPEAEPPPPCPRRRASSSAAPSVSFGGCVREGTQRLPGLGAAAGGDVGGGGWKDVGPSRALRPPHRRRLRGETRPRRAFSEGRRTPRASQAAPRHRAGGISTSQPQPVLSGPFQTRCCPSACQQPGPQVLSSARMAAKQLPLRPVSSESRAELCGGGWLPAQRSPSFASLRVGVSHSSGGCAGWHCHHPTCSRWGVQQTSLLLLRLLAFAACVAGYLHRKGVF